MTPPRTMSTTPHRTGLRPFASGVSCHGEPYAVFVVQADDEEADIETQLRNAGAVVADVDRKPATLWI